MSIEDFEKTICELLANHADFEIGEGENALFSDELTLAVAEDGCLAATFNGEAIPCEGEPWAVALDRIVDFVRAKCAQAKDPA